MPCSSSSHVFDTRLQFREELPPDFMAPRPTVGPSHSLSFFLTSHQNSTKDSAFPLKHGALVFMCFTDVALALIVAQELYALIQKVLAFSLSNTAIPRPCQPKSWHEMTPCELGAQVGPEQENREGDTMESHPPDAHWLAMAGELWPRCLTTQYTLP